MDCYQISELAARCGRQDNIEFNQTPDKSSKQLANGEHTLFDVNTRCKICGGTSQKQKQTAKECQRLINLARMRHNTCHMRARVLKEFKK